MCPSCCNMSVSAYGMSLLRELGWVGRLTVQMKIWGFLFELSQAKTQGYGKGENMAMLLPHSIRGASKASHQHQGHPRCAQHGVALTQHSDAGTPWNLPCTHHIPPVTLQPCQRAEAVPGEGEKQETGRKANTAASSSLSVVAAGPVGCLIFETWLDNPGASAGLLQIISQSLPQMCRTGSLPHFVTVLEGIHVVLQATLRMASIINNHYDFFSVRLWSLADHHGLFIPCSADCTSSVASAL